MRASVGIIVAMTFVASICGCAVGTEGPDESPQSGAQTRSTPDNTVLQVGQDYGKLRQVGAPVDELGIRVTQQPVYEVQPALAPVPAPTHIIGPNPPPAE